MIHLGDITKIHGDQIEPVDCITFGSPCQDLSMAGLRAGLEGKNSGLFTEAIRVIVEMRVATNGAGTAVWASEIEEFPIAVTKRWFGNDTENESNSGAVLRG